MFSHKKCIVYVMFLNICVPLHAGFKTLQQAQQYAAEHAEYPDADNTDWLNPDYTSYYKKMVPSFFSKFLQKMNLQKGPLWTPKDFEEGLEKVMAIQTKGHELIGGMVLPESEPLRFVVWTDLRGSYHSFVRALTDLRSKNIIDDNFKITAKNTYFIINGNVVCGSPYILQTMTIIFELIIKNPENVIYQRGAQQNTLIWETCGLGAALKELSGVKSTNDPLFEKVNLYIQAMPYALYIRDPKTDDVVRISPYNKIIEDDFEEKLGSFATDIKTGKFFWYSTLEKKPSQPKITLRTIVEGYEVLKTVEPMGPLEVTKREKGNVTVFHILSSQTRAIRQVYRYFYDAYGMIIFNGSLKGNFLLMSRDVRTNEKDFSQTCYELLSGKKMAGMCDLYL